MLSAAHRLRRRVDFADTVRRGRRAARRTLVVHALVPPTDRPTDPVRAGFVVSRAVGGSVVRHQVARRLRHLMAERLDRAAPGTVIVVRALPPAAVATSAQLGQDLDAALARALRAPDPARVVGARA